MNSTPARRRWAPIRPGSALALGALLAIGGTARAADLKVMGTGLGSGTITSMPAGIACGADCDESYGSAVPVQLTASGDGGASFSHWEGDCSGTASTCNVTMDSDRSVRAVFQPPTPIPALTNLTPGGIQAYLTANPTVDSAPEFVAALPAEFRRNWILITRSKSTQTGTAASPRILLPSADARSIFGIALTRSVSFPAADPNAVEYMQWDSGQKNFRYHELVLGPIPMSPGVPARTRSVSIDEERCSRCHSTRNVLNKTPSPGTDGVPPGTVPVKNRPNWDPHDSWGGATPFNHDRIYKGSLEAAAFRRIFNPWTWRAEPLVRAIVEQLELQPPGVPAADVITRISGGTHDGLAEFSFDDASPVTIEPRCDAPPCVSGSIFTNYMFNGEPGMGPQTEVHRGGPFVTLRHSGDPAGAEGRSVQLFDLLGGNDGSLNQERIADELLTHRVATGSMPIDVRALALAISRRCLVVSGSDVTSTPAHNIHLPFFTARNGGMTANLVVDDTRLRAESLPRRKADDQRYALHRAAGIYFQGAPLNGLIQEYGGGTFLGTDTSMPRIRREVFRRPIDAGNPDQTDMGNIYVDREDYGEIERIALFRYFLEPLGVSVDEWSMGARGHSRTYTFGNAFSRYADAIESTLAGSLGLAPGYTCADVIPLVDNATSMSSLPGADDTPTYTDVQRIFNKACVECHNELGYPPHASLGSGYDNTENEDATQGDERTEPSHSATLDWSDNVNPASNELYRRITNTDESCPDVNNGMMPCEGPALSRVDVETIRRWIVGNHPHTLGDPHIRTIDGTDYDFQAAGEFVLLRDPGLEVQARQTPVQTNGTVGPNGHTGLTSCVSLNTAAAVRVGSHRISYQPKRTREPGPGDLELRIDGKPAALPSEGIALASGGRVVGTPADRGIQIEAPGGTTVIITPAFWDAYQVWYLNIDVRNARATEGVMGAIAPGNWLPALPDGSWLGPRPESLPQRYAMLYEVFGEAWRVTDETTLFEYAPGTSTGTFAVPSWPLGESPAACEIPPGAIGASGPADRGPPEPLPAADAEAACARVVDAGRRANCVADVAATGERGFARSYEISEELAELNRRPAIPRLTFPDAFEEDLTTPIAFTWEASNDEDGDALTYRHCVWPAGERQTFEHCTRVGAETEPWDRRLLLAILVLLVVLLVFGLATRRFRLVLVALLGIAIVLFLLVSARDGAAADALTRRSVADLEPGETYYWKVIVDDTRAGTTASETRRFSMR